MNMITGEQVIRQMEEMLNRVKRLYDSLSTIYPTNDLRLSAIGLPGNALHSYLLFAAMVEYTITHESWWKTAYGKDRPSPNDITALRNLESLTKHAFFVFFLSRIEWTFRKMVTYLYPGKCNNGGGSFKSIYDYLLSRLGLSRYIPLYDLCRHIRNSIHSNGIYISRNGNDQNVMWRGVNYTLRHMQPIDFVTHDLIFQLHDDLIGSIEELLNHPTLKSPNFIEDKIYRHLT